MLRRRYFHWAWIVAGLFLVFWDRSVSADDDPLKDARRIVFLGDSITYAGDYVAMLESAIRLEHPDRSFEFLVLGLPSETVSGLSEPGHAGGRFARPDLHERLDRILTAIRPDLVVACYGMNCGIYHPYSDERFEAYRQGVRDLAAKVAAVDARLVFITPPIFDPQPILANTLPDGLAEYQRPFRDYNRVLDVYAAWLIAEQGKLWTAVDTHGPMNQFLIRKRLTDKNFQLAADGVHLNEQGHWLIARELLPSEDFPHVDRNAETFETAFAGFANAVELLERIRTRQRLLTDAWLTNIGHTRPEMAPGLPLDDAVKQASKLDVDIQALSRSAR